MSTLLRMEVLHKLIDPSSTANRQISSKQHHSNKIVDYVRFAPAIIIDFKYMYSLLYEPAHIVHWYGSMELHRPCSHRRRSHNGFIKATFDHSQQREEALIKRRFCRKTIAHRTSNADSIRS